MRQSTVNRYATAILAGGQAQVSHLQVRNGGRTSDVLIVNVSVARNEVQDASSVQAAKTTPECPFRRHIIASMREASKECVPNNNAPDLGEPSVLEGLRYRPNPRFRNVGYLSQENAQRDVLHRIGRDGGDGLDNPPKWIDNARLL